jgi:hypothetical protein
MEWRCKAVGYEQALKLTDDLHTAFMAYATASRGQVPTGLGVFAQDDLETGVVNWYFSPEAAGLAAVFAASPCAKPTPEDGFGLLVGDQRSWEFHFPDYIASRRRRHIS